jgi:hypothetical protein
MKLKSIFAIVVALAIFGTSCKKEETQILNTTGSSLMAPTWAKVWATAAADACGAYEGGKIGAFLGPKGAGIGAAFVGGGASVGTWWGLSGINRADGGTNGIWPFDCISGNFNSAAYSTASIFDVDGKDHNDILSMVVANPDNVGIFYTVNFSLLYNETKSLMINKGYDTSLFISYNEYQTVMSRYSNFNIGDEYNILYDMKNSGKINSEEYNFMVNFFQNAEYAGDYHSFALYAEQVELDILNSSLFSTEQKNAMLSCIAVARYSAAYWDNVISQ